MSDVLPAGKIEFPEKFNFLFEHHRYKVLYGGRAGMKCLALGTKVIMADGTLRAVEDVKAGESVMGPDSAPRRVSEIVRGFGPLFRVKQTAGIDYVVNSGHILSIKKSKSAVNDKRIMATGNPRSPNGRYPSWPGTTSIAVDLFAAQSKRWQSHFRGHRAGCLSFPALPVSVDPYLLGVWLGDGNSHSIDITNVEPEITAYCRALAMANGGDALVLEHKDRTPSIGIRVKEGRNNPVWGGFKEYGLPNNKHIPQEYLSNCEETRLHLLAGLLDTDGHLRRGNGYIIEQVNERLAREIKFLADGLGFRTNLTHKKTVCGNNGVVGEAWRLSVGGDVWRIPCRVRRKIADKTKMVKKDFLLSGLTIERAGIGAWAGFELDGDHLFLLEDGTVTHNTFNVARALLYLGANEPLRILCAREVQKSIRESVHEELRRRISEEGLEDFYSVTDQGIRGINGTEFIFSGLNDQTAMSLKSYAAIDICWVEEAQTVTKWSWGILLPTIREPGSEVWVTFNPDMDTDETYQRFIVNQDQFEDIVVVKTTYADNKWLSQESKADQIRDQKFLPPDEYANIWEGAPRTAVVGAIYGRELQEMIDEHRIRPVPYDPRVPVHTVWDLGWNDRMCVIFFQKPMFNAINVINYLEDSFKRYDEYIGDMERMGYRWGTDYLPHDALSKDPKTGMSTLQIFRRLGRRSVSVIGRGDIDDGIRKARMLFPRIYMDNTPRKRESGHLGTARLIECLRRYRRKVPSSTGEASSPVHDEFSHGADAWRYLAMTADRVANSGDDPSPRVREYSNPIPSMGWLG